MKARVAVLAVGLYLIAGLSPPGSFRGEGRIAYIQGCCSVRDLHVIAPDGSGERRIDLIDRHISGTLNPSWSPDGRRLAIQVYEETRCPGCGWRIAVVEPDGSGFRILTPGPGDEDPSWSADGKEIIWREGEEAWVMSADGSSQRPLQNAPEKPASDPYTESAQSPDGDYSAWVRESMSGGSELVVGDSAGQDPVPIASCDEGCRIFGMDWGAG